MTEEFEEIRPYTEEEALEAFQRLSKNPLLPVISKYLFPHESISKLSNQLRSINSIQEYQDLIMVEAVDSILARSSEGFSFSGVENLKNLNGKFLAVSNHRDIVLDPALILYTMRNAGLPYAQLCVGSNLLKTKMIEDLMRTNRMIKVIRGIGARQMYLNSKTLSEFIRQSITSGESSVWIAQKEGRAKDGNDLTEQGLLKMFDMSGTKDFQQNFEELNIVPMAISYEFEPCGLKKARELYIKAKTGSYTKKANEDTNSIVSGIGRRKGHIHLSIGTPLTREEIAEAAALNGNEKYQHIRGILDERIHGCYKLWKTNYMGYDLMNGTEEHLGSKYLPEDLKAFKAYTERELAKLELGIDRNEVRKIFWSIYGNPVKNKKD